MSSNNKQLVPMMVATAAISAGLVCACQENHRPQQAQVQRKLAEPDQPQRQIEQPKSEPRQVSLKPQLQADRVDDPLELFREGKVDVEEVECVVVEGKQPSIHYKVTHLDPLSRIGRGLRGLQKHPAQRDGREAELHSELNGTLTFQMVDGSSVSVPVFLTNDGTIRLVGSERYKATGDLVVISGLLFNRSEVGDERAEAVRRSDEATDWEGYCVVDLRRFLRFQDPSEIPVVLELFETMLKADRKVLYSERPAESRGRSWELYDFFALYLRTIAADTDGAERRIAQSEQVLKEALQRVILAKGEIAAPEALREEERVRLNLVNVYRDYMKDHARAAREWRTILELKSELLKLVTDADEKKRIEKDLDAIRRRIEEAERELAQGRGDGSPQPRSQ